MEIHKVLWQVVAAAPLVLAAGCASTKKAAPAEVRIESIRDTPAAPGRLNQAQLQALTMNMADLYASGMIQYSLELELAAQTTRERFLAHELKHSASMAAMSLAVSPSPEAAFLDMLVLVSMSRVSIDRRMNREDSQIRDLVRRGGDLAEEMRRLEQTVWREADRVLTNEQQQELHQLIDAWLAEHPNALNLVFVRLNDFSQMRDVKAADTATGLLKEVSAATQAVDQVRLLGERALWYGSRAPTVWGFQVEQTLYDLADQPETRQALANVDTLSGAIRDIATGVNELPKLLDRQRTAWFDDVEAREGHLSEILSTLRDTVEAAKDAALSVAVAVDSIDRVVARFDTSEAHQPLDLTRMREAAVEAATAADEFTQLLQSVQGVLASPEWEHRSKEIGQAWGALEQGGRGWITLTFRQGLYLIGAGLVATILYRLIRTRLLR